MPHARPGLSHALAACLLLALIAPSALAEDKQTKITASPLSLSVTRPVPNVDKDSDLARFAGQLGTEVKLLIRSKGKGLIGFDDDASKVDAFTDDQGNSLIEESGFGQIQGFAWFRSSAKGDIATIDVNGRKTPGKGATSLRVKGKLVFQAASKQSTHRHTKAAVAKGTKVKAGPIAGEISETGKPQWGDEPLQIELKFKGELPPIAEVRFFDAQGKRIESSSAGGSRMSFLNNVTTTKSYTLSKKVPSVTVEFVVWDDVETVELPLNLVIDVGQ